MRAKSVCQQMTIENEILTHVSQALSLAVKAPIQADAAEEWLERFTFLGDSFHRHITRLFAIEEDGGYMDFVLECPQPTLSARVELLRGDHRGLLSDLATILEDAKQVSHRNVANLHELKQRLSGFLARFAEHRRKECELCFEAFLVDIGGEGG